jgi:hypothetical protein
MAQHDMNVGNAAGSVVRADINAALEAIITNNSGATEPATPYANMWWYDTSTATLKRRNNANDAWIVLGLEAADTDGTLAANSDSKVATQKATKTYIDAKTIAENRLSFSDNTTANASTSAHGLLKKLSNVATEFMNGLGNWVSVTIDALLPSMTGNSGKFLTNNGSVSSWGTVSTVPTYNSDYGSVIAYAGTERATGTNEGVWVKLKEITLYGSGTLGFSWEQKGDGASNNQARIYKNGSAVGTTKTVSGNTYSIQTDVVSGWANGDKIQLYAAAGGSSTRTFVKELKVFGSQCTIDTD